MNLENMKQQILDIITIPKSGDYAASRMTDSYFKKHYPELRCSILDVTKFYTEHEIVFSRRVLLIINNITSKIMCIICNNEIDPNKKHTGGFGNLCSSYCAGKANLGRRITYTEDEKLVTSAKRESTMLSTYGVRFNSQRLEVKDIIKESNKAVNAHIRYDILEDADLLISLYAKYPSTRIGDMCNCDFSVVIIKLKEYGVEIRTGGKISKEQYEIADIFNSFGCDIKHNRRILNGYDIDVYSELNKFGVEYNGFPWHLELFGDKDMTYHHNKTNTSKSRGISLFHVFPYQLYDKKEIVKSIISHRIGKSNKIHGRKCKVLEIGEAVANEFLIKNSLNDYEKSDIYIGVLYNDVIVSVMSFSKKENNKWEMLNYCTELYTTIVGGASKLITYFKNNYMGTGDSLFVNANRTISEGACFELCGMSLIEVTQPTYYYVNRKTNFYPEPHSKYEKNNLVNFPAYSVDKTEWEIMKESGYDRYWDSGCNVYSLTV
jgi:hypothetical protein